APCTSSTPRRAKEFTTAQKATEKEEQREDRRQADRARRSGGPRRDGARRRRGWLRQREEERRSRGEEDAGEQERLRHRHVLGHLVGGGANRVREGDRGLQQAVPQREGQLLVEGQRHPNGARDGDRRWQSTRRCRRRATRPRQTVRPAAPPEAHHVREERD